MKNISDDLLHASTLSAVKKEKQATSDVLDHLREVEDRRLFAKRGYSSLWEYSVKYLGYSESGASERIGAMRLIREVPAVESKIQSGELTLTTAAQVQRFARKESLSSLEKINVIEKSSNKSKRELEKLFIQESKNPAQQKRPEKLKAVTEEFTQVQFLLDQEGLELLEELKNLRPGIKLGDLFKQALKTYRDKVKMAEPKLTPRLLPAKVGSRYVRKTIKAHIHHRSGGRCEYVDSQTRKRCDSKRALQYDHIRPFAKGGETTAQNLRHYCPAHNQLAAIRHFGRQKIDRYIKI